MGAKLLVANRGEIAVRVIRAAREIGLRTVAVYSEADREALHVRLADEAVAIGPAPAARSYLNQDALFSAAAASGADAVHPGYGFLSENPEFAAACEARGLVFVGPTPENIRLAGNKLNARQLMASAGVPVIPGSTEPVLTLADAHRAAGEVGYPVMLKAAAGGGGRGMRVVESGRDLDDLFMMAQAEARAAFGDPALYVEKLVERARHVEVQVVGDGRGGGVHLGERNCSLQRRHQKMLEEAPSPALARDAADRLHRAALDGVRALAYRSAGTFEFLMDEAGRFYFMEINARIQVEHPVTEAVTGVDLVKTQIIDALERRPSLTQRDIELRGHAIECRINAEDPDQEFLPQPGTIERLRWPGGFGVRIDSHVYEGYTIPIYYDSLLAKVIAHGRTRDEAMAIAARALDELVIGPGATTARFLRGVLDDDRFRCGDYTLDLGRALVPEVEEE
jgi:acetyl-CoA carboxylase, biotin carboxylase subunit